MTGPAAGRHDGLVAVITGSSRGLGAGMAEALAADGFRLGLCARTRPSTPAGASSEDVLTASVDVTDAEALDRFAGEVVARFGRIDLWVNNAGLLAPIGPLADADPGEVTRNIEVNVLGVMHGSATFARHVRSRSGGGVLVNVSSGAATRPTAGWAPYGGAKAAVEMITEVVAREERPAGLRAYALAPGLIDTDMQALIRSTSDEDFPSAGRFRQVHEDGAFNSPAWVTRFILDQFVDGADPGPEGRQPDGAGTTVRFRVPDQQ
jgi:NAD(P)-dependent dehydrogenase (short-subunit alcohol dehydrogenase family)